MANSTLQEWLNRNAFRAFPLEEDSDLSCAAAAGAARALPNGAVLDARFFLDGEGAVGGVFLERVGISESGIVSLEVSTPEGRMRLSGGPDSSRSEFQVLVASIGGCHARVVAGSPESLAAHAGDYRLNAPPRFLRSRVLAVPSGIGADTITCGGVTGHGDIRVANGVNTELGIRGNSLVLKVRKGIGLGLDCPTLPTAFLCSGNVLYFLNGQKADSSGNIQIYGGEGVSVTTGTFRGIPAVIVTTSMQVNNFIYR